MAFKAEGEQLLLIGGAGDHLGQSLWLREVHGREDGPPPFVDLATERKHGEFVRMLIAEGLACAVHDVSDGGPLVAAVEMALASKIGFVSLLPASPAAFAEDQGRIIITASSEDAAGIRALAEADGVVVVQIGYTSGDSVWFDDGYGSHKPPSITLADLRRAHEGFFPTLMGVDAALA